jgi:hypothetical protein
MYGKTLCTPFERGMYLNTHEIAGQQYHVVCEKIEQKTRAKSTKFIQIAGTHGRSPCSPQGARKTLRSCS